VIPPSWSVSGFPLKQPQMRETRPGVKWKRTPPARDLLTMHGASMTPGQDIVQMCGFALSHWLKHCGAKALWLIFENSFAQRDHMHLCYLRSFHFLHAWQTGVRWCALFSQCCFCTQVVRKPTETVNVMSVCRTGCPHVQVGPIQYLKLNLT
jgi:hypothetical protein